MHFNLKNSHKVKRQKTTQEREKRFNRIFKLSQMETFPDHNHAAALTPTNLSNATDNDTANITQYSHLNSIDEILWELLKERGIFICLWSCKHNIQKHLKTMPKALL